MKNRLLILDIDNTLLFTKNEKTNDCDFSFSLGRCDYFTLKRPFLDQFMEYAFDNFKVAVWTAAGGDYAARVLTESGVDLSKLEFVWSQDKCVMRTMWMDGVYDYYGIKRLSKVHRSFGWDLDNILIVDDVRETASQNYGNLIKINPFTNNKNDVELLKLMSYLEKIKDASNFRNIEKRGWSNF